MQIIPMQEHETPDYVVPVFDPSPVGTVEWVVTPTRLYGIDRVGHVFVFAATPAKNPRHRITRRAGRLRLLVGRLFRGPVFS